MINISDLEERLEKIGEKEYRLGELQEDLWFLKMTARHTIMELKKRRKQVDHYEFQMQMMHADAANFEDENLSDRIKNRAKDARAEGKAILDGEKVKTEGGKDD